MLTKFKILFTAIVIVYLGFSSFFVAGAFNWFTQEYFSILGTKAMDIAAITARSLIITDEQFVELKSIQFSELEQNKINQQFTNLFKGQQFSGGLRFAYIMTKLEHDEIKYYVEAEDKEFYDAPVGTPLNRVWLLDVVIDEYEYISYTMDSEYFKDKNRYSFMRPEDDLAYEKKQRTYVVSGDEWGDCISGFVPIYTIENTYIGLLGVDIYFEQFGEYRNRVLYATIITFFVPSIILTFLFYIVYAKYMKIVKLESYTDHLTELYNRAYLNHIVPKLIKDCARENMPLSIIMIDIDKFKNYNDTYGHLKGDACLKQVAIAIKSVISRPLDIVCRYGGEEMIAIMPKTNASGAAHVAQKIHSAIKELNIEHKASDVSNLITVSQGVYTTIPSSFYSNEYEAFIEKADKALYSAKETGRNKFVVYSEE